MTPERQSNEELVDAVLGELAERGLVLQQHAELPDVVARVTGEALSRSWWSHPRARDVFAVLSALAEHADVTFAKLVDERVTLVHRKLWPALCGVGRSREPWQLDRLTLDGQELLGRVDEANAPVLASGRAARELQARLLASAQQVHTESGRHETALETWDRWATAGGVDGLPPDDARATLEEHVDALGASARALPWNAPARRTR